MTGKNRTGIRLRHRRGFRSRTPSKDEEALTVEVDGTTRVMEVAQHIGDGLVRCIMLSGSEGMGCNMEVVATGDNITVPVGPVTLGRMFNVLGEPIDGGEALPESTERWRIHRKAPRI